MSICTESFSIPAPNYCPIPNVILDEWIHRLGHAEFKILMFISRKTFGWHKIRDRISLSQIHKATGFTRSNITNAIRSLCKLGLLMKMKMGKVGEEQTYYEIVINENSNNSYQSYKKTPPSPATGLTKDTLTKDIEKEKDEKEKVLCGVKTPAPPDPLFSKNRVKMEKSAYERLVSEFGEEKIEEMIQRLDEYADINPRRFKQYAKHDVVIRKWIREDNLKPKTKAEIAALEQKKRDEEIEKAREQQKINEALEAKKRMEDNRIFQEQVDKNFPILQEYLKKYSSVLRIYSKQNALYEIKDQKYNYHLCPFNVDNFEEKLQKQLREFGVIQ